MGKRTAERDEHPGRFFVVRDPKLYRYPEVIVEPPRRPAAAAPPAAGQQPWVMACERII
jgi:hypothetical protein